ncbi:MAG: hypothetical protein HYX84_00470 [Chloroflexi bacterium]|nr:hypothetical protein [Chloroflexota bacterium]
METRESESGNRISVSMGRVSVLFNCGGLPCACSFDRIQKGLTLAYQDAELVEEGTGFGVPIVKLGYETVLPGYASIVQQKRGEMIRVNYHLNLAQRLRSKNGKRLDWPPLYWANEWFSRLHRKYPAARGLISGTGHSLRKMLGLIRAFEETATFGTVAVTYIIHNRQGLISVDMDLSELPRHRNIEIIITNEQGASHFDSYRDSEGTVKNGEAIGTWEEVQANEASLIDRRNEIVFSLERVPGARLFRGRELAPGTLAWSGLDYVLTSHPSSFSYDVQIGRLSKE